MKALDYIKGKSKRAVLLRAFHIWQLRPYKVAPMSETMHECASCGTVFQGNYCPRCGQSAGVGRFSFKKALLLFLDVWGMGNRSMFRTIRDLMFRPGYVIRDYLRGMQSAYFPPFKLFFLLTAFALIVEHGFSLGLDDPETSNSPKIEIIEQENEDLAKAVFGGQTDEDSTKVVVEGQNQIHKDSTKAETEEHADKNTSRKQITINGEKIESPMYQNGVKYAKMMDKLRKKNPAIFALLSLVLFSIPLFFFLRSCPAIPDLRFSEFIVALVYTSNTYSIYSITGNLLNSGILKVLAVLMIFVTLKQFSGYSKRRLLGYLLLTLLISAVALALIGAIGIFILYINV